MHAREREREALLVSRTSALTTNAKHTPPLQVLCQDGRAQPPVPTIPCDSGYDQSGRKPAHRCELDGKGSHNEVAEGKYERAKADPNDPEGKATGSHCNPRQPIWADGLDTLGKKGRANKKPEDVYVVCWTEMDDPKDFYGGMKDPFKQKLHQPNVDNWLGSGQTKWVYDDFDPKYGLVRVGSHGTR